MAEAPKDRIPITIITGFVGSGKTTLILNLLPQLRRQNPDYKLALIKNEIGDLNVDSQLAAAAEMTGTRELLGACICCTNVGQIGHSLQELDETYGPDRIIIETSGSAEPIKLVIELKRLAQETGRYELDGVIGVIDVENWDGYASTSYTAKLQARQTDLIVMNKWEHVSEMKYETCLDRLGDMDVETPQIKSDRGWISKDLLFGMDKKLARDWTSREEERGHEHGHSHGDGESHDHNEEMECLSVTLNKTEDNSQVDLPKLEQLLKRAPKDEVYRIKAIIYSREPPTGLPKAESNGASHGAGASTRYILNWSFGRHSWTKDSSGNAEEPLLRMSIFTARYESNKWQKRIEAGQYLALSGGDSEGALIVKRVL